MAKSSVRLLKVRIPAYKHPRNEWRKEIHEAVWEEMTAKGIRKASFKDLPLEIRVRIYFDDERDLEIHDVDNMLKDIMDALQGRMGGPKNVHKFKTLIANDKKVYKVSICKQLAPPQSKNMGHLEIREYRESGKRH